MGYCARCQLAGRGVNGHHLGRSTGKDANRWPSNQSHHRSGAALYYNIAGTGSNTVDGKTEVTGSGSFIYEHSAL
jgi:hypothetical protein